MLCKCNSTWSSFLTTLHIHNGLSEYLTVLPFQETISADSVLSLTSLFHMQLACYLIVCESRNKNALYFRFIQRAVQSLVNVNFVFPITINSQPRAMIQLLLCSLLAMPRLCNYLCRRQWLSSALADSLQYIIIVWMYRSCLRCTRAQYILRLHSGYSQGMPVQVLMISQLYFG